MRAMPPGQLAASAAYHGNLRFGFHQALPGPARYITFLRDPLQRIISRYQMLRRLKVINHLHRLDITKPNWNLAPPPGFAYTLDNWQTRVLAGLDRDLAFGGCREEHFVAARENLERHFDFVGLTERFDLSVLLLNRLYRWPWRFFVPHNVAPVSSPMHAELPGPVLDAIRQLNQYDYRLYAYAQKRFDDAVARAGLGLSLELPLYRAGNAVHRALHRTRHALKPKSPARRAGHTGNFIEIRFSPVPTPSSVFRHRGQDFWFELGLRPGGQSCRECLKPVRIIPPSFPSGKLETRNAGG